MTAEDRVSILLGDPKKAIITMAIPLVMSLLVSEVNVLADRAWCSGLGDDVMSAIAVVIPIYLVIAGFGSGLGVGASAVISRMIGADRQKDASVALVQALLFGAAFGLVLIPILVLTQGGILEIIGKENILQLTEDYMLPYSMFAVFIVFNGVVSGVLTGQGQTQYSMYMMLVQAASNMVLDPIFIYYFDMGLPGASIATVIATIFSMILGIVLLFSKKTYLKLNRSSFHYDSSSMRMLLVAGVPQMLEYAVMWSTNIILNCIVLMSAEGSHALTIYSVPDNLMDLIVIPALAIGSALVPVASSALGQREKPRMRKSFGIALKLGIAAVFILAIFVELFPEQFLFIFTYTGEMLDNRGEMVRILRIMCPYVVFFAFTPLCSGYLQALGHPSRSVIMALWRNLILIIFFLIALPYSVEAIMVALVVGHIFGAISIMIVTLYTEKKVFKKLDNNEEIRSSSR